MPNTLTDQYIALTYGGILHAQGAQLPATGQTQMYDGEANKVGIRMGRHDNGMTLTSLSAIALSANDLEYPKGPETNGYVVTQTNGNRLTLESAAVGTCQAGGIGTSSGTTYGGTNQIIESVTVKCGLVTGVQARNVEDVTFPAVVRTYYWNLESGWGGSYGTGDATIKAFVENIWIGTPQIGDVAYVIGLYVYAKAFIRTSSNAPYYSGWKYTYDGSAWIFNKRFDDA